MLLSSSWSVVPVLEHSETEEAHSKSGQVTRPLLSHLVLTSTLFVFGEVVAELVFSLVGVGVVVGGAALEVRLVVGVGVVVAVVVVVAEVEANGEVVGVADDVPPLLIDREFDGDIEDDGERDGGQGRQVSFPYSTC